MVPERVNSKDRSTAKTRARAGCVRAVRSQPIAPCATDDAHGWDKCVPGRDSHAWHLKSAADGVSRCELQPSTLRCIRCRAATAPDAAQHGLMIPRLCFPVWLSDSSTTVIVALLHCGGLHLRLDIYVRFGRPLGSGQLGRGTLAGRGTACVRALLVHGSFAVQRLQVRMATVEPMSVCV